MVALASTPQSTLIFASGATGMPGSSPSVSTTLDFNELDPGLRISTRMSKG